MLSELRVLNRSIDRIPHAIQYKLFVYDPHICGMCPMCMVLLKIYMYRHQAYVLL